MKKAIATAGITADRFASMTAADIEELFPDGRKTVSQDYADPHFAQVIEEMKHNRFFTLQQGWVKYLGDPASRRNTATRSTANCSTGSPPSPTSWPRCNTNRARRCSWTGSARPCRSWTLVTGETSKAYFFVASLPYSGLVFCQAFSNMKQEAWNQAHVNALAFIGGVPQLIVPDNARTATHKRTRADNEVVVTKSYRQLAEHYQTAIVPARSNRPRDKAHVERMVQAVESRVIGYLASETWTSFEELNDAVQPNGCWISTNSCAGSTGPRGRKSLTPRKQRCCSPCRITRMNRWNTSS